MRGNILKIHPEAILDLRGSIIPIAMLELTKSFNEVNEGETMEILFSDQETRETLFKVLKAYPYELLDMNDGNEMYRVRIRKGQPRTEIPAGRC